MGTDLAEKPMNKTERSQLRSVVKNRFELLRDQLRERGQEIRDIIRQQIREEHKGPLDEAEQRSKAIARRLKSAAADTRALHMEMEAKGLKAPYSLIDSHKEMDGEINKIVGYYLSEWEPKGIDHRVEEKQKELKRLQGTANLNLRHQEISILEELAVGGLVSEEARKYLDKVPGVDDYMPLPSGDALKALTAGS